MHPADITAKLKKARGSQAAIARSLGVSKPYVSQVVNGLRGGKKVRAAIAQATGIPVTKLWPNSKKGSA